MKPTLSQKMNELQRKRREGDKECRALVTEGRVQ